MEKETVVKTGDKPETEKPVISPAAESGSGGLLALGLAAAALMLSGYVFYQSSFGTEAKPASGFYVVDSDRLAASYLTQAMSQSQNQDPEAVRRMLEQNLQKVREKLSGMSEDGMIIIQRSAVVTYPKGADITERIARELGISLLPEQPAVPQAAALPPASLPSAGSLPPVGGGAELD